MRGWTFHVLTPAGRVNKPADGALVAVACLCHHIIKASGYPDYLSLSTMASQLVGRLHNAAAHSKQAGVLLQQQHGRHVVCSAKQRRQNNAPVIKEDFDVPQVGWMWDSGKAAATRTSLKAANIKAKKSLGQNFCTDDNVLSDIVTAARVTAADAVIEVGPGTGNLTRHLIASQASILAVEKDDTLIERLRDEFKEVPNLQLIHGDVMRLNLKAIVTDIAAAAAAAQHSSSSSSTQPSSSSSQPSSPSSSMLQPDQQQPLSSSSNNSSSHSTPAATAAAPPRQLRRVKVVANLPYNITKDFLLALLPQGDVVSELSIMIQEEVAQRLVDPTPGRPDYRAMSVITHYYSKPVYRFRIPKEKYFPVPGVDGALVTFKLLPPSKRLQVQGGKGFVTLVNKAFSERRKMMRNTLQPLYTSQQVEAALTEAGIRPDARAQDLTVEQFARLYNNLQDSLKAAAAQQ